MPIVPSRASEIKALVDALGDRAVAKRDAAQARLILLGERSRSAVVEALRSEAPLVRLGALGVLDRLGPDRALPTVLALVEDPDEGVAHRAAQLAEASGGPKSVRALARGLRSGRPRLAREAAESLVRLHEQGTVEALEPLLAILLDEGADEELRLVASRPIASLPRREAAPILKRLAAGRSRRLARAAAAMGGAPVSDGTASIPSLHAEIVRLSSLGPGETEPSAVATAKADLHLALARLDTRIALYDLREMLEARPLRAAGRLLEAAAMVGDKSFVPVLARLASEEPALAKACASTFAALVRRESLRPSKAFARAVRPEHREALARLWSAVRAKRSV